MENKVTLLAAKLLKEGVEQGELEKTVIIDAAHEEASAILESAEKKASAIISAANAKAVEIKHIADSEIKLSGTQTISALKQKIVDLIITESIEKSCTSSLSNPKIMSDYIRIILQNWKTEEQTLEFLLPEAIRSDIENSLELAIQDSVTKSPKFTFTKTVKSGFQIIPSGKSYKISLTDEDFAGFFKEFLRPRVRSILFGE